MYIAVKNKNSYKEVTPIKGERGHSDNFTSRWLLLATVKIQNTWKYMVHGRNINYWTSSVQLWLFSVKVKIHHEYKQDQ